jgi:hypothetical protein
VTGDGRSRRVVAEQLLAELPGCTAMSTESGRDVEESPYYWIGRLKSMIELILESGVPRPSEQTSTGGEGR